MRMRSILRACFSETRQEEKKSFSQPKMGDYTNHQPVVSSKLFLSSIFNRDIHTYMWRKYTVIRQLWFTETNDKVNVRVSHFVDEFLWNRICFQDCRPCRPIESIVLVGDWSYIWKFRIICCFALKRVKLVRWTAFNDAVY